ncbi:esterase/lipase family protein [Nesterenkonia haasae]|uniref:esterase/lipase family protein n=1 Tax=Nesterenkonia haasae TaxID=2587813 RepID=UPI001391926C|nr:alpha/beta hydrolase [Nesterenkonia haasae]NDK32477.1 alpha/beta hydrolase [Nesterenkonia haasae]
MPSFREPARWPEQVSEAGTNLTVWARDYGYALRQQAVALLRPLDPRPYHRPNPEQPTVILLPGIYEPWTFMLPIANELHEHGYDVRPVVELGYNGGTLEDMAAVVNRYIQRENIGRCVLVAHSKGGLIGKHLLARHNEAELIQGLVTLNTPFEGSPLARLLPLPAIRAFLPRSPELAELGANRNVDKHIVSIYGRFDPHIPGGSYLGGARNVQLSTRGHFLPLSDRRAHRAVLEGVKRLTH